MLTLLDLANHSPSDVIRGAAEIIVLNNKLLQVLPVTNTPSQRAKLIMEGNLPDADFRGDNEEYTESNGTYNPDEIQLRAFGGKTKIDRKLAQIPGYDIQSEETKQIGMKLKSTKLNLTKAIVKGDVATNAKSFNGIYKMVSLYDPGFTKTNLYYDAGAGNTNGVALGTDASVVLDNIESLIESVQSSGQPYLIGPRKLWRKIKAMALKTAANNALAGMLRSISEPVTINGVQRIMRYYIWDDSIICFDPGVDRLGANIMDYNETRGSSDVTTSIAAFVPGDTKLLQDKDMEILPYDGAQVGSVFRGHMIDWSVALQASPISIARLSGILA